VYRGPRPSAATRSYSKAAIKDLSQARGLHTTGAAGFRIGEPLPFSRMNFLTSLKRLSEPPAVSHFGERFALFLALANSLSGVAERDYGQQV
jgi:hypothetical protein